MVFLSACQDRSRDAVFLRKLFGSRGGKNFGRTGGPGPNAFGGLAQPAVALDAQHDLVSAIEEWVERGVAPARITATKYVHDDPSQGVAMQRPICPYPEEPRYKGSGSTADAGNFACVKPAGAKVTISQRAQ